VPDGTTLRTHLSSILNCDPMRITKKFTGDSCIGKRIFQPLSRCDVISDNGNNGNNGNNSTSSSSSSFSSSSSSAPTYNSSSIVPGRADSHIEDSKEHQIAAEYADLSGNGGRQGSRQQQNTDGSEETRDKNTYSNNSSSSSSSSSSSCIGGEGNSSASVRNVPQDGLRNVPQDGPSLSAPYVSHGLKQQQQQVSEPTRQALESSDISNNSVTSSSDVIGNSSSAGVRTPNSVFIDNSRKELRLLRRTWLEKMLSAEREMARKNVKSSSSAKLNSGKIKVRKRLKRTVRKYESNFCLHYIS
jgi:hypothetical protein